MSYRKFLCYLYLTAAALVLFGSLNSKAQTLNITYIHSKLSKEDLDMLNRMAKFEATFYNQVFHTTKNDSLNININIYGRAAEYNKLQKGIIKATFVDGFYSSADNRIFIYKSNNYINTLFHEASHNFLQHNMFNPPRWLNEGIATIMEHLVETTDNQVLYDPQGVMIRRVRDSISNHHFDLNGFFNYKIQDWFDKNQSPMLYATSYSIVYFLVNQQKDYLTPVLQAILQGSSDKEAFIKSFGSLDNFTRKFYYFYISGAGKAL